jgi:hypothetical protein
VFAVQSPTPVLEGSGALVRLGSDSLSLAASSAGRFLIRVHNSRYLALARGHGCLARAPGGWTFLDARTAGTIVVAARLSLGRALGLAGRCA